MTVPRPEIVSFSMTMEERMASNDAEKGDSWKTMKLTKLGELLLDKMELFNGLCGEAADAEESEMKGIIKDMRKAIVDVSNLGMMVYHRTGGAK